MNRALNAVLVNRGFLKKQLQNYDLIVVMSRSKASEVGRRGDYLANGEKASTK